MESRATRARCGQLCTHLRPARHVFLSQYESGCGAQYVEASFEQSRLGQDVRATGLYYSKGCLHHGDRDC